MNENSVIMLSLEAQLANGPGLIHPTVFWDGKEAVLADAGLPGQLPLLRAALAGAGIPLDAVRTVVVTHSDMDHVGGLAALTDALGGRVRVLCHKLERPYVQGELPPIRLARMEAALAASKEEQPGMKALVESLRANYRKLAVPAAGTLDDGDRLPLCGGIDVIATPGHTPGHLCLYHPMSRTLVAGDALGLREGRLAPSPDFLSTDRQAAARSLMKLAGYGIGSVICYHGGRTEEDASGKLATLARAAQAARQADGVG